MSVGSLVRIKITGIIGIVTERAGKYINIHGNNGKIYSMSTEYVEVLCK